MRQTIFKKLTISLTLFSVFIVVFMWLISGKVFDREFQNYLEDMKLSGVEELFSEIEAMYIEDGEFTQDDFRDIRRSSNRGGYSVSIEDGEGNIVFENPGTHGLEAGNSEGERVSEFVLDMEGAGGTVSIGFRETKSLGAEDLVFQGAIKKALALGGAVLIFISILVSYVLSRRMSRPIMSLKLVAERIKDGELSQRYTSRPSDSREIYELSESIDQMASALKSQEELRKQLVSDMAHELRTPIAVLKSHLEAMVEGVWEISAERLEELYVEVDMLSELVDKLKDIHKLEGGSQMLSLETVDLKEELEAISKPLWSMFREKDMKLETDIDSELYVKLDRGKFKQIVYNLLLNAYKYSDDGTVVELKAKNTEDGILISVSDNGVGISREDLPHIFERFYRGEKSRNREYGGTGLGLTIVKALVEAHGWEISAESELGSGSEFVIKIYSENFQNS